MPKKGISFEEKRKRILNHNPKSVLHNQTLDQRISYHQRQWDKIPSQRINFILVLKRKLFLMKHLPILKLSKIQKIHLNCSRRNRLHNSSKRCSIILPSQRFPKILWIPLRLN